MTSIFFRLLFELKQLDYWTGVNIFSEIIVFISSHLFCSLQSPYLNFKGWVHDFFSFYEVVRPHNLSYVLGLFVQVISDLFFPGYFFEIEYFFIFIFQHLVYLRISFHDFCPFYLLLDYLIWMIQIWWLYLSLLVFNLFGIFFIDFLFVSSFYTWFIKNYVSLFFSIYFFM